MDLGAPEGGRSRFRRWSRRTGSRQIGATRNCRETQHHCARRITICITHAAGPANDAEPSYDPGAAMALSATMSASGVVMIRVLNPAPPELNAPVVIPAPRMSALVAVVVAAPLDALVPEPDADAVASTRFVAASPEYSSARTSAYGTAPVYVTVTTFAPAAAGAILVA